MKPFLAVDLLTGESVGRFTTYAEAATETSHLECVDIQYRPRAKRGRM